MKQQFGVLLLLNYSYIYIYIYIYIYVIESRGFQQNVEKQTGNTKKNSVRLLQLTILCPIAISAEIWR